MTKLEALKELAEKVDVGEWVNSSTVIAAELHKFGSSLHAANNGSLDAAKALHDAVLGDKHPWSIGEEAKC